MLSSQGGLEMPTTIHRKQTLKTVAAAALLLLFGAASWADSTATPQSQGLRNEQEIRKKRQQEYIREHSDPSGKVRPDAYVKGMEHVRQMKVAPQIGAKPVGEETPGSAHSNH
jgi:hypothetical protein